MTKSDSKGRKSDTSLAAPTRSSPRSSPLNSPSSSQSPATTANTASPISIKPTKDADVGNSDGEPSQVKKKVKTSECPCGKSSAGKCWLLTCPECKQVWHNSCAGLKAEFTKPVLDSLLKSWLCPWCFVCPFPKPNSHRSVKHAREVRDRILTAQTIQQITDSISNVVANSLKAPDLDCLGNMLSDFSREVQEFKSSSLSMSHITPPDCDRYPEDDLPPLSSSIKRREPAFSDYQEDFLEDGELEMVKHFLQKCKDSGKFSSENGHSVVAFGEHYSYVGSKSNDHPDPIPPELEQVIDKLVSEIPLQHRPNAVLINHYTSASADESSGSFLPFHCDDESVIIADSKIATLSLGGVRAIRFQHIHEPNKEDLELSPAPNSVYCMTRTSQAWYKHGIPAPNSDVDERYSITFRCVNSKFNRSILVVGDSNTQNLKFGEGKGKFGESYPGKRVRAADISQINPAECIGYSHVIIVCGTNNLRLEAISHTSQIRTLVDKLKHKLSMIKQLCPKAKITVTPVLPSRLVKMNNNITIFNDLVDNMLARFFKDIWFPSLHHFLDNESLLASNLTRNNDPIHLGDRGIAGFVSYMKHWVYQRELHDVRVLRDSVARSGSRDQRPPPAPS